VKNWLLSLCLFKCNLFRYTSAAATEHQRKQLREAAKVGLYKLNAVNT
jgi:hypothetical protein